MQKNLNKIILVLIISSIITSCTTSVRFTSNSKYSNKNNIARNSSKSNSIFSKNSDINEKYGTWLGGEDTDENEIVIAAEKWLGVPYLYGGTDESGIDCSSFTQNVYSSVGINIPRTAGEQFEYSQKISNNDRKTGDLIFFKKGGNISHVGLYVGNDEIIHASSSQGVTRMPLNTVVTQMNFAGFGRVNNNIASK